MPLVHDKYKLNAVATTQLLYAESFVYVTDCPTINISSKHKKIEINRVIKLYNCWKLC